MDKLRMLSLCAGIGATRGFTKGYITPSANCTLDEVESATRYAQGLDAAEMQRLG